MANIQTGYGKSDVVAPQGPFDLYVGAVQVFTGAVYTMQNDVLVLVPAAAVTGVVVNFPLNPPDGALIEITNAGAAASTVTLTPTANTGDTIVNGGLAAVTVITSAASGTAGSAAATIKYRYSLAGSSINGANARTWYRVQ